MKLFKQRHRLTKILAFLLCLSLLPLFTENLTVSGLAAPDKTSAIEGGFVPAKYLDRDDTVSTGGKWTAATGSSLSDGTSGNSFGVVSYSEKVSAAITFDDPLSLGGFYEVGILMTPMLDSAAVTVTADFDKKEHTVSVQLDKVTDYYVYLPVPEDAEVLSGISFTVDFSSHNKKNPVSCVSVEIPLLSRVDHAPSVAAYSAFACGWAEGDNVSGSTAFTGEGIISSLPSENCLYIAELTVTKGSGSLSFFFSSDGHKTVSCGSSVIRSDRDSYMFALPSDARITPHSFYRIEFTGDGARDADVSFVSFYSIPLPSRSGEAGEITECFIKDSSLTVSGTLTRDTVVNFIDGSICLYEVMPWEMGNIDTVLSGEPVEAIPMSSSFTFSRKISKPSLDLAAYIVVIEHDGEMFPLGDASYPARENSAPSERSSSAAVTGISCEDAFASGYDGYIIDIDADTLFAETGGNASAFTISDDKYFPQEDSAEDIRKKADFLAAAGLDLIFRIHGECATDVSDEEGVRHLYAAMSYLSSEFSPGGFILVTDLPDIDSIEKEPVSNSKAALFAKAENDAALLRIASVTAEDGTFVCLEETADSDSDSYLWYLTKYMTAVYSVDFEYVIRTTSPENAQFATVSAADAGYSSHISLWMESAGAAVPELTEGLTRLSNTTFIISLTDGDITNVLSASVREIADAEDLPDGLGTLPLFDFSDGYDIGSVTPSILSDGIFIRNSDLIESVTNGKNGVLRTALDGDAPVLVMSPEAPLDIRNMPFIGITFGVRTASPARFDIVFISGSVRAVRTVTVESDVADRLILDLSDTCVTSSLEKVAFILREGEGITLELSSVTVMGTGDASSPEELYITETTSPVHNSPTPQSPASSPSTDKDETSLSPFIAVTVAVMMSVMIFVLLSIGGHGKKKVTRRK